MDDLTTIKGVGPATARQLNDAGITSFDALKAVDPENPPFALSGGLTWEYLRSEVAQFVADTPNDDQQNTEERSGTAREAPSTDSGTPAVPDVEVQPAAPSQKDEGTKRPSSAAITVKGPRRGRWRAGRHFTHELVAIPRAELSDDQLAALQGDPELTVTIVE